MWPSRFRQDWQLAAFYRCLKVKLECKRCPKTDVETLTKIDAETLTKIDVEAFRYSLQKLKTNDHYYRQQRSSFSLLLIVETWSIKPLLRKAVFLKTEWVVSELSTHSSLSIYLSMYLWRNDNQRKVVDKGETPDDHDATRALCPQKIK